MNDVFFRARRGLRSRNSVICIRYIRGIDGCNFCRNFAFGRWRNADHGRLPLSCHKFRVTHNGRNIPITASRGILEICSYGLAFFDVQRTLHVLHSTVYALCCKECIAPCTAYFSNVQCCLHLLCTWWYTFHTPQCIVFCMMLVEWISYKHCCRWHVV